MLRKAEFPSIATQEDSASTTSTPSSEERQTPRPSATAGSVRPSSAETSSGKSLTCENSTPTPKSSLTSPEASTGSEKDCSPYWSGFTAEISSLLWLPTETVWPASGLNSSSGWLSKTAAQSWFSTSRMPAPNPNSPRIYSPSSILSAAVCTDSGATAQQSRKIRVYPTTQQKLAIKTWLDASRWTYNLTVEILRSRVLANWQSIAKTVMADVGRLHPEWEAVPYQVKRTAVRDACRAVSNVKRFNKQLAAAKAKGERLEEDFAELHFRSRKNPRQSCYIPDDAVTEHGVYYTILGPLRMAEAVPSGTERMPAGEGTGPVLDGGTLPGAMRHRDPKR